LLAVTTVGAGLFVTERRHRTQRELQQAREAYQAGRFEESSDRFARYLQRQPDDHSVRLEAVSATRRAGKLDNARELLEDARKKLGFTREVQLEILLLAAHQGETTRDQEVGLLDRAQVDADHRAAIFEALAYGAIKSFQLLNARVATEAWLKFEPQNAHAHFLLGEAHFLHKSDDDAISYFKSALKYDPNHDDARQRLAELLVRKADHVGATPHFEELLKRRSADSSVLVGLASCRAAAGRDDEAIRLLDEVLSREPSNGPALRERGMLEVSRDRPEQAESWLRRATEAMPTDMVSHYNLYQCLLKLNRDTDASAQFARHEQVKKMHDRLRELYTKELEKRPGHPDLLCEIGVLHLNSGDAEWVRQGLVWIQRALNRDVQHKPSWKALADYYTRIGDHANATRCRRLAGG
jgi:predicted Zn-dependent protease